MAIPITWILRSNKRVYCTGPLCSCRHFVVSREAVVCAHICSRTVSSLSTVLIAASYTLRLGATECRLIVAQHKIQRPNGQILELVFCLVCPRYAFNIPVHRRHFMLLYVKLHWPSVDQFYTRKARLLRPH